MNNKKTSIYEKRGYCYRSTWLWENKRTIWRGTTGRAGTLVLLKSYSNLFHCKNVSKDFVRGTIVNNRYALERTALRDTKVQR